MDDRSDRHRLRRLAEQLHTALANLDGTVLALTAMRKHIEEQQTLILEVRDELNHWAGLPGPQRAPQVREAESFKDYVPMPPEGASAPTAMEMVKPVKDV